MAIVLYIIGIFVLAKVGNTCIYLVNKHQDKDTTSKILNIYFVFHSVMIVILTLLFQKIITT